jgi:hypothetical protein
MGGPVMRSILLFFLILLVVALAMQAQEGDPGADVWISVNTYPPTISGCLVKWGFYYYVVGKDGTVYNLSRCTRGLGRYVRHEVELTGIPTLITLDTTVIHAASTVQELPALEVKGVKELSESCSLPDR